MTRPSPPHEAPPPASALSRLLRTLGSRQPRITPAAPPPGHEGPEEPAVPSGQVVIQAAEALPAAENPAPAPIAYAQAEAPPYEGEPHAAAGQVVIPAPEALAPAEGAAPDLLVYAPPEAAAPPYEGETSVAAGQVAPGDGGPPEGAPGLLVAAPGDGRGGPPGFAGDHDGGGGVAEAGHPPVNGPSGGDGVSAGLLWDAKQTQCFGQGERARGPEPVVPAAREGDTADRPDAPPVRRGPATARRTGAGYGGRGAAGSWTIEIWREDRALDLIADDWYGLYDRCSTATPFQSHAWLRTWWREYGRPGRMRLVLVWRRDRLVGAAPLMVRRRGVLGPIGGGLSDLNDMLVDDAYAGEATAALVRGLAGERGWSVLDLCGVRAESVARNVFAGWEGPRWRLTSGMYARLENLAPVAPASPRVTAEAVSPGRAEAAMGELVRLHALWKGGARNPKHTSGDFLRHMTTAARVMVSDGDAALTEFRLGGRVVALDFTLLGRDFVGSYLYGADPEFRHHLEIPPLLLRHNLALARERGTPLLGLPAGAPPYGFGLPARPVAGQRVILGRGPRSHVYAALARATSGTLPPPPE
ncbi:GNAT family N-acetyltransferase [Bailinhaonella thermotolerans]|uniref:GNAT family N-acetyltransferase n=1 Tax=Bailinhaonella thermotolerans TaxID=1070861 RepID=A0A3A4ALP8_9ACTN|nr:GNAT family N-acetyltransferase [Bailinhaonella thermotolerans]RJL22081.1 GNAT family N-acetyltransferase [Bailinhaonella thermotolerans]